MTFNTGDCLIEVTEWTGLTVNGLYTLICVFLLQIGDIRVSFEYAGLSGQSTLGSPEVVSIITQSDHILVSLYIFKA